MPIRTIRGLDAAVEWCGNVQVFRARPRRTSWPEGCGLRELSPEACGDKSRAQPLETIRCAAHPSGQQVLQGHAGKPARSAHHSTAASIRELSGLSRFQPPRDASDGRAMKTITPEVSHVSRRRDVR